MTYGSQAQAYALLNNNTTRNQTKPTQQTTTNNQHLLTRPTTTSTNPKPTATLPRRPSQANPTQPHPLKHFTDWPWFCWPRVLNAFWVDVFSAEVERENVWKWVALFADLDQKDKANGRDLDEFQAHRHATLLPLSTQHTYNIITDSLHTCHSLWHDLPRHSLIHPLSHSLTLSPTHSPSLCFTSLDFWKRSVKRNVWWSYANNWRCAGHFPSNFAHPRLSSLISSHLISSHLSPLTPHLSPLNLVRRLTTILTREWFVAYG